MKVREFLSLEILKNSLKEFWIYLAFIVALPQIIGFYFPQIYFPYFLNWKISFILFFLLFIFSYYRACKKNRTKKENKKVIDLLGKNQSLQKSLNSKEKKLFNERIKNKEWDIVIGSLKNKSLLKENLIKKYSSPLPIILFQYGNQKINNKGNKFIKEELEKNYDVKSLGCSLKVIPPKKVPKNIRVGKDLEGWFYRNIQSKYKDSSCVISVLAILDLKNTYWKTDYDYDVRYFTPLGKALGLEDIFTKKELSRLLASENVSILDPILEGDLSFLCSFFLTDTEMKKIYSCQEEIEEKLNLDLKELADKANMRKIEKSIEKIFPNSYKRISKKINEKAEYWNEKLNKIEK